MKLNIKPAVANAINNGKTEVKLSNLVDAKPEYTTCPRVFDSKLPTVNQAQVPSWALHIECPHCHTEITDWLINPEHRIHECDECGKQFNITRDLALEIT
jgi:hypothetical protein